MSTPPPPPSSDSSAEAFAGLDRLRKRVEEAASEIERLRDENAALAERVETLAAHDVARDAEAAPSFSLGGDPETLREQIEGFIEAIDRMLAPASEPPTAPEPAPAESTPSSEPAS